MMPRRYACRRAAPLLAALLALASLPAGAASVAGRIQSHSGRANVADVTVQAQGPSVAAVQSDVGGTYAFSNLSSNDWQLVPSKVGGTAGAVNALDALYALQA